MPVRTSRLADSPRLIAIVVSRCASFLCVACAFFVVGCAVAYAIGLVGYYLAGPNRPARGSFAERLVPGRFGITGFKGGMKTATQEHGWHWTLKEGLLASRVISIPTTQAQFNIATANLKPTGPLKPDVSYRGDVRLVLWLPPAWSIAAITGPDSRDIQGWQWTDEVFGWPRTGAWPITSWVARTYSRPPKTRVL